MSLSINGHASAASFDCARASTPQERLICADPELSDLDSQLGMAYAQRRSTLSPANARHLQDSELSWLRFIKVACRLDIPKGADPRRDPRSCLRDNYTGRVRAVEEMTQRIGAFQFDRFEPLLALDAVAP